MTPLVVTIDGPAASGKSTVARRLAEKLDADFLDTGAMYRAVVVAAMRAGAEPADPDRLLELIEQTEFHFATENGRMTARIGDTDITDELRKPEVTAAAHYVAGPAAVRSKLVEMQRNYARNCRRIVTEGRDQGTVAFADADIKFFLTADINERAARRRRELEQKNITCDQQQLRSDIEKRDRSDTQRSTGPLKPAPDAVVVDTTTMSVDEVVGRLLREIEQRCSKKK